MQCTNHLLADQANVFDGAQAAYLSGDLAYYKSADYSDHLADDPGCPTYGPCPEHYSAEKQADYSDYNSAEKQADRTDYEPGGCLIHDALVKTSYLEPCPQHNAYHLSAVEMNDYSGEYTDYLTTYLSDDLSAFDYDHRSAELSAENFNENQYHLATVKLADYAEDYSGECTNHFSDHDPCPQHYEYHDECPSDEPDGCTTHLAGHKADYFSQHVPPCTGVTFPEPPEFEPYAEEYPGLNIPTYEEFKQKYPQATLPMYEKYREDYPTLELPGYTPYPEEYPTSALPEEFPTLDLEHYQQYGVEYPKLGEMFELSEAGIRELMANTGLPVDELMKAYTAEEKAMLDEYLPQLREQWSSVGLLRSGMTAAQELKAVHESARKMATTRAELEKESVVFQRQGLEAGIGLAMQHVGMEYGAATDAYEAGRQEHQKAYDAAIQKGLSEYEAEAEGYRAQVEATRYIQEISERRFETGRQEYRKAYDAAIQKGLNEFQARTEGYNAQIDEHIREFVSSVEARKFAQGIEERAFEAARQEYQKVFDSRVAKGLTEFEAQQAAYEAGLGEYGRVQKLEFDKWQTEYEAEVQKYLMELGFSAAQAAAAAQGWGNIFGTVIGLLLKWLLA